jgi:hypothetical protein
MKCSSLQNGLQVDVILIFLSFQINEKSKRYLRIIKLCML